MAEKAENMETSLSEDLEASIEMLEGVPDEEETGGEIETAAEETTQAEVPAEKESGTDPDELQAEEPVTAEPQAAYKAPIDWSPTLKQEWGNLPEQVQKAIHDREVSVNHLMQQTAQDRRTAQTFNSVVQQFSGLMAAEGVADPMQGVHGLLTTTAQLAMGAPVQKAAKIAELIKHYGVDIETLDTILAGQQPANTEDVRLQQMLEERMKPFNDWMAQMNQQRAAEVQGVQNAAYTSIHEFGADPKNEFFDDVRLVMADFLDIAAQQGREMSLKEAYDKACALDPEISAIIAGRPNQQQRIAQKEAAASSISGRNVPAGKTEDGADLSIRESLERSFGDAERRI